MYEESEDISSADVAILRVVEVPELGSWSVRITVAHAAGACDGWAPLVFWSQEAAELWLRARSDAMVRPSVRDCPDGPNDLAFAAIVDDAGNELLVSEPVSRVKAAGVAALFAAEFRSYSDR